MSVDFPEIRHRLDLVSIAEGEGLQVWRRARGVAFVCPACGKGDKSGKGALTRDGARWHCVRCEEGGDVIDLLRLARGLDKREAIKLASRMAGLDPATGYDLLRERLDVRTVADRLGLWVGRMPNVIQCPACGRRDDPKDITARCDKERWHCVRCNESGDAIDLIQAIECYEDRGDATRIACLLGNVEGWTPRRAPVPPAPEPDPLADEDLAERMRAVQAAADHYRLWAGEWRQAEARFYELLEAGAWQAKPLDATEADNPCLVSWRMVVRWERERREPALGYIAERMGAMHEAARPIVRELVGLCPSRYSGLRAHLLAVGGPALVEAAERAGLFLRNGAERFAGRLVYFWTLADGQAVYLTGRAVPALVDVCNVQRDSNGEVVKGMALPVFNPDGRGDRLGVPAPSAPFGAHLALVREGPVVIVEGELDAIHQLVAGPAVATGGTGRMGNARGFEALRRVLAGREAIVAFDLEADPDKQRITDKRAADLAHAIGAAWVPGGRAA